MDWARVYSGVVRGHENSILTVLIRQLGWTIRFAVQPGLKQILPNECTSAF